MSMTKWKGFTNGSAATNAAGDCLQCILHNGVVPLKDILAVMICHVRSPTSCLGDGSRFDSTAVSIKTMIPLTQTFRMVGIELIVQSNCFALTTL